MLTREINSRFSIWKIWLGSWGSFLMTLFFFTRLFFAVRDPFLLLWVTEVSFTFRKLYPQHSTLHSPDGYAHPIFMLSLLTRPWLMVSQLEYTFLAFKCIREEWRMHGKWPMQSSLLQALVRRTLHLAILEQLWILPSQSLFNLVFNSLICPIFFH